MDHTMISVSEHVRNKLDQYWLNFMAERPLSYISCAAAYGDGSVYRFASGSYKQPQSLEREVTVDTRFQVGSVTKVFTSLLSAMLIDRKLLHPEDPVIKYLPQYAGQDITLRHLMTHTAGYRLPGTDKPKKGKRQDYMDHIYQLDHTRIPFGNRVCVFLGGFFYHGRYY